MFDPKILLQQMWHNCANLGSLEHHYVTDESTVFLRLYRKRPQS